MWAETAKVANSGRIAKAGPGTPLVFPRWKTLSAPNAKSLGETWESEMLCRMPSQEALIYKEFDLSVHVI